jgi:hypothetical protein
MKTRLAITKKGRTDAMEVNVDIQAPPIPGDTSTKGPVRQTEATRAPTESLRHRTVGSVAQLSEQPVAMPRMPNLKFLYQG